MNIKKAFTVFTTFVCALAWAGMGSSCVNPKEVIYIQDVNGYSAEQLAQNY